MPLIHKNNSALYAGVSKQASDLRLDGYVEDMTNCYPSIQYGVRRRNPTQLVSEDISVESNQFVHTYDRGLSGESEEQYLITIDKVNGLRVFDVNSNSYRTVTYSGAALKYLENSNPEIGFSALTVKDTTFIANKDIIPIRIGEGTGTKYWKSINFNTTGFSSNYSTLDGNSHIVSSSTKSGLAPARIKTMVGSYTIPTSSSYTIYSETSSGALISVTIDGSTYKYQVAVKNGLYNSYPETILEMRTNIYNMLSSQLNPSAYKVELGLNNSIIIYRLDGVALSVSTSCVFPSVVDTVPPALSYASSVSYQTRVATGKGIYNTATRYATVTWTYQTEYNIGTAFTSTITGGTGTAATQIVSDYDKQAFIWIKQVSVDSAFPYTFYATLKETNGTTISSTSSAATTTTGVASAISAWADAVTGFTASASGSVVKIARDNGTAFDILVSDTYGDQASSAWRGSVSQMDDLPKEFPFKDTIVKVDGVKTNDDVAYFVKYDGNQWVEWRDPNMLHILDNTTMPHKLVRNADYSFTLSSIVWDDILVGDENTQSLPEFVGNGIRDLFFIGGRLGILTKNGISLSQQGNFFNFFRTTVLELLDDSAIATYIDSSKSVGLEYAVELQGSIVLFGDKLQFAIDGSRAISPVSIMVKPISGFEINKNVKPVSVGDSVFFIVNRSGYSAMMEMTQNTISSSIDAEDISSHVQNYIDSDIMQIIASQQDNSIFLRSRTNTDTIYLYKYYGTEQQRLQTSWSKWKFSSDIKSIFCFSGKLYLFSSRYDSTVPLEDFSLATIWNDSNVWIDETYWVDGDILSTPSFEYINVNSSSHIGNYKDNGIVGYDSNIVLSEFAVASSGTKDSRLNVLFKTIEVSSVDGSNFDLDIDDLERGTSRSIPAVYTVGRKPYVSGNAKNMRVSINSYEGDGFEISSVSLEGQVNSRSVNKQ